MSWRAKIWAFVTGLAYFPAGRAAIEVFFAVMFTFAPILLLSIPFRISEGELTKSAMWEKFLSFWESGEIILPILAVCGAIAALAVVHHRKISVGLHVVCWFSLLTISIGCGFALSQTEGFSATLYPEIIRIGFLIYVGLLVLWFAIAVVAYRSESTPDPEKRVDDLLAAMRAASQKEAKE